MCMHLLRDISFDEQDANLFQVDDARLRADALKHSVLPRLRTVMNAAISQIRSIYRIEALDDSIVSVYPNFRQKRELELKMHYDSVFVGLGGQRKPRWPGMSRKDGKPVQILPFRFAFVLTQDGIFTLLENGWLKGLDDRSFELLLRFHIEHEDKINPLCFHSEMRPAVVWDESHPVLTSLQHQYQYRLNHRVFDNHFFGHCYHFPVSGSQLMAIVDSFSGFFPVYDSYLQIAKGLPVRINLLIDYLSMWLQQDEDSDGESSCAEVGLNERASLLAESKARVMPAVRWQVFQRDQWRCVACGRTSHDGAILHVDHIIPRSRGGADALDNFQTLCDVCNLGKSNRDSTDLRDRS